MKSLNEKRTRQNKSLVESINSMGFILKHSRVVQREKLA